MENFFDRSQFLFSRFDKYFDIVNTKGTVYLAINTFFIGAVLSNISNLDKSFNLTELTIATISLFLASCFISTFLVLLAINPFLKSGTKNGTASSIFYYGSIAEYEKDVFIKRLECIQNEELRSDVGGQLYCLAEGLKFKYNMLKWSGWVIIGEFLLLIPVLLLLTIHLK
jgi:hypothetical protein